MATVHNLQLALADGLGPITIARLLDAFGTAERVCAAAPGDLSTVEGIGTGRARTIHAALRAVAGAGEKELRRAHAQGLLLLAPEDPGYPPLLRHIPDPPAVLYCRGSLEPRDVNAIAIVGSRRCSLYGSEQAERFASLLAAAGFTVISGGARGVDSASHRGALAQPIGRTIAVLGCGVDIAYPPENASLFHQISAGRGAILSEYPLGTPPMAENFPRRNRIVSGLSRGVLVMEADEKSGALITARQAIDDHNRPVFAVPGRVDNPLSAGPHLLIRQGAVLTAGLTDILDNLPPVPEGALLPDIPTPLTTIATNDGIVMPAPVPAAASAPAAADVGLSERQRAVLTGLQDEVLSVDELVERTRLEASEILQELTFMSLKGVVRRVDGQHYARRGKLPG